MDMTKRNREEIDTKEIEEKALNYFKTFIEDSKVISQFLAEDDKEPCWDGHLYLYSDGMRDKEHLLGRVPVQIKGTEVVHFVTKKWKFELEKVDLKAYLHEPTFFIVCQVKKDSKERKLFYRELLPDLVNKLLRDMGQHKSRKTLFHPLTNDLKEFEDQLKIFMGNSKKMVSFADAKPLSIDEAIKKGVKEFSFIAPSRFSDTHALFKYLSTHNTYLYAKVSKDLNIDIPLSDGPARFAFVTQVNRDIKIGDKVFFKGFKSEIKDGRLLVNIADVITINIPMDDTDKMKPSMKMTMKAKYLKDAINEADFAVTLNDVGVLTLGDVNLPLAVNERKEIEELRQKLGRWKELDAVLDKLHVTKPFDLTNISQEQSRQIDLLIDTVGKGNVMKLPGQETALLTLDISNIKLLLWLAAGANDVCSLYDFFDKAVQIAYKVNENKSANVSSFSYLQNDNLWETIDNIDYDNILESAKEAAKGNDFCYHMSNYDVLAMISAYDVVNNTDAERGKKLLDEALRLDEWLIDSDPRPFMKQVHIINKLQILKRQRALTVDENEELEKLSEDNELSGTFKVAIYLLQDKQLEAEEVLESLPEEEKETLKRFPIWKFYKGKDKC